MATAGRSLPWLSQGEALAEGADGIRAATGNPLIHALVAYWQGKAGGRPMPARADIDPAEIPWLLPHVWLMDVLREAGRPAFRYRLVGTAVATTFPECRAGWRVEAVYPDIFGSSIYRQFLALVERGAPQWRRGPVLFDAERKHIAFERVLLPLASDGRAVDMTLGLTVRSEEQRP